MTRSAAPRRRVPQPALGPRVSVHVHPEARWVWLEVVGTVRTPGHMRRLLAQLRRAHRRFPASVETVGVDLRGLGRITVDLAALLLLERRVLQAQDVRLGVVLRGSATASAGTERVLGRLPAVHADDGVAVLLAASVEDARLAAGGAAREVTATADPLPLGVAA